MSQVSTVCRTATALLLLGASAQAMPRPAVAPQAGLTMSVRDHHRGRPVYHVNRYGYGHYTRGPGGSYGPYRGGSGAAFIYKQQRHQMCENAPSRC